MSPPPVTTLEEPTEEPERTDTVEGRRSRIQGLLTGRRNVVALAAVLAVGLVVITAVTLYQLKPWVGSITLTAQFDSAAGLYEDNVVSVIGMPVGKIKKITPKGSYVEVEFTVDKGIKIPADAQAVTINTSILTARQIELTPPYRGGPVSWPTTPPSGSIGLKRRSGSTGCWT